MSNTENLPPLPADKLAANLFKLLGNPLFVRSLFLWGVTGIGKSSLVDQTVRKLAYGDNPPKELPEKEPKHPAMTCVQYGDWGLIDLRISLLDSSDLRGIPYPEKNLTKWFPPEELPLEGQEERFPAKGVLFLDEMNHAEPAVQAASYSLVLDRKIGPHKLMPGWKVMGAGNLQSEEAFTHELGHPLKNRFLHYMLAPSFDAFKKWGYKSGIHPDIIAFLNFDSTFMHKDDQVGAYAFPTPRSWEYVSEILKIFSNGDRLANISACIGQGTTAQFLAFLEARNRAEIKALRDIPALFDGSASVELSSAEPIIAWAFSGGLISYIKEHPDEIPQLIKYVCSKDWAPVREIGRLLLKDIRLVDEPRVTRALTDQNIYREISTVYKDFLN